MTYKSIRLKIDKLDKRRSYEPSFIRLIYLTSQFTYLIWIKFSFFIKSPGWSKILLFDSSLVQTSINFIIISKLTFQMFRSKSYSNPRESHYRGRFLVSFENVKENFHLVRNQISWHTPLEAVCLWKIERKKEQGKRNRSWSRLKRLSLQS